MARSRRNRCRSRSVRTPKSGAPVVAEGDDASADADPANIPVVGFSNWLCGLFGCVG
jgi:hypothetical protein